jgi:hypothetical protein
MPRFSRLCADKEKFRDCSDEARRPKPLGAAYDPHVTETILTSVAQLSVGR